MLSFPSLISTDQPSQTSQEDEGPEQPPNKARARSTGVMGLGRETCCLFFVEAPRPRISEACFPCLNSCVLHIQVVAKNVSPVLQSYRILLHVARRAKLHVLNTCVRERRPEFLCPTGYCTEQDAWGLNFSLLHIIYVMF